MQIDIPTGADNTMITRCELRCAVWLIAVITLAPQGAIADDATPRTDREADREKGVCNPEPKNEERARQWAQKAHILHKDAQYREAGDSYREAIAHWNRPRYHLKAGIAYMSAMRVMDAHAHIAEALRCGEDVLSRSDLDVARTRMQRLKKHVLAEIEVQVSEPGTRVLIDNQPWFEGIGARTRTVRNGQHLLTVEKPGYVKVLEPVTLESGQRAIVRPRLLSDQEATIVTRRWQIWLPWTTVGAGLTVGALGLGFRARAMRNMGAYQRTISGLCPQKCTAAEQAPYAPQRQRAIRMNVAGWTTLSVGGAVVVTGLIMAFLNREQFSPHPDAGTADVEIVPLLVNDTVGVAASGRF